MSELKKYRHLEKGEIILADDQCDFWHDGWKDNPIWKSVNEHSIGKQAPDPRYPSHTKYRRLIK